MTFTVPTNDELALVRTRAAEYRVARAAYKQRLNRGEVTVDEAFDAIRRDDPVVGNIRLGQFLRAFRGVGPKKAERIGYTVGAALDRRMGGLGRRQREGVYSILVNRQRSPRPPAET